MKYANVELTSQLSFVDELLHLIKLDKNKEISSGEVNVLLDFFLKKFEEHDPFYAMLSKAYNLSDIVYMFSN